jgi:hypothetical protein
MTQSNFASSVDLPGSGSWHAHFTGPLFLLLAALLATAAGWLPNRILLPDPATADVQRQRTATEIAPWTTFAGDCLANKDMPLWSPYSLLGTPILGNGDVGVFYPTVLLHAFVQPRFAFVYAAIVCLWVAGIGAWWLARRWGVGKTGQLAAGVCYMFCGANVLFLNHPYGQAAALLPAGLALVHRLLTVGKGWSVSLLALVAASAICSGRADAAVGFLVLLILGALCTFVGLLATRPAFPASPATDWDVGRGLGGICMVIGAVALAILMTGAQWLTFAGYVREWGAAAFRQGRQEPLTPSATSLIGLVIPWFVKSAAGAGSVGVFGIILAGFGMRHGRAAVWAVFAVGLAALACSAAGERWVFKCLALSWDFRPILMAGVATALAVLAGFGLDRFLPRAAAAESVGHDYADIGAAGMWIQKPAPQEEEAPAVRPRPTHLFWIAAVAVEGLIFCLAMNHGTPQDKYRLPAEAGASDLLAVGDFQPLIDGSGQHVRLAAGSDVLLPPRMLSLLTALGRTPAQGLEPNTPVGRLAGVTGYLTTRPTTQPVDPEAKPPVPPLAWIARSGQSVASATALAGAARQVRSGTSVVVDPELAPEFLDVKTVADAPYVSLTRIDRPNTPQGSPRIPDKGIVQDSPDQVRVRIADGTGGWLVVAEPFAPGWQATQIWPGAAAGGRGGGGGGGGARGGARGAVAAVPRDKKAEADSLIYPAYGFLQAVPLPASAPRGAVSGAGYDLLLEFSPMGWRHGRMVSAAGGMVWLLVVFGQLVGSWCQPGRRPVRAFDVSLAKAPAGA